MEESYGDLKITKKKSIFNYTTLIPIETFSFDTTDFDILKTLTYITSSLDISVLHTFKIISSTWSEIVLTYITNIISYYYLPSNIMNDT